MRSTIFHTISIQGFVATPIHFNPRLSICFRAASFGTMNDVLRPGLFGFMLSPPNLSNLSVKKILTSEERFSSTYSLGIIHLTPAYYSVRKRNVKSQGEYVPSLRHR